MGEKRKTEKVVNDQVLPHLFFFILKRNFILKVGEGERTFILYIQT